METQTLNAPPAQSSHQLTSESIKGSKGVKRIFLAAGYSASGLSATFKDEAAFRQLLMLNIILIPLTFFLNVSNGERALLIATVFSTLIIEILNSAIEATVDRISLSIHPLSKRAKDMGSAAQLLSLTLVILIWSIILI